MSGVYIFTWGGAGGLCCHAHFGITPTHYCITTVQLCYRKWLVPFGKNEMVGGQGFIWPKNSWLGVGNKQGIPRRMGCLGGPRGWVREGDVLTPTQSAGN